ncbi:MAG: c-type cytochrome [Cryomorphaceae bacterium]|nr:c-type cytochrome [Cryomorphaceae bacterium]
MNNTQKILAALIILSVFAISYHSFQNKSSSNDSSKSISKMAVDDPFSESTIKSEFIKISADKDTIIEGKNGTVIQIPKGAFKDSDGNIIEGEVVIELAEPETFNDFLLSGISAQSGEKLLDLKGTFFINATQSGKQLFPNQNNPIYIEKPIIGKSDGDIRIFSGEKREDGQIVWKETTTVEKYLIPIDLVLLDFLPQDFEREVENGMPFRNHQSATKALVDSLYYSLENKNFRDSAYFSDESEIFITIYDKDSVGYICGIRPATIKTIKSEKFNKTTIATRAFEARLKEIFKSCDNSLIQLYVDNLDKNLWEIDEMVAEKLGEGHDQHAVFKKFSDEKLTKVKNSKSAIELSHYYRNKLENVQKQLKKLNESAKEDLRQKREIAEKKRQEYHDLLRKREKYRLEKFGFKISSFGWKSGAIYIEDLEKFILEITVNHGDTYDRVHTYIVNNHINSLFSMTSKNNILFNRGHYMDKHLLMWKESNADAIVIAYKADEIFFGKQEFTASTEVPALLTFDLSPTSKLGLKYKLRGDFWRKHENDIKVDLKFQAEFAKERERQNKLFNEYLFISKLKEKAFACCEHELDGKMLFMKNCSSCHEPTHIKKIGPGLAGATSKHELAWLIAFTQSSRKLIYEEKDPDAVRIFEAYNGALMPEFPLSEKQVIAVFDYIDGLGI